MTGFPFASQTLQYESPGPLNPEVDTQCLTMERSVPNCRNEILQDENCLPVECANHLSTCRQNYWFVVSVVYNLGESCLCDVKSRSFFVDGRQKLSGELH